MKAILKSSKPYIIAETAYSFEGDKNYLLNQISNLKNNSIDCIKYHILFNISEYVVDKYLKLQECLDGWILDKEDWVEVLTLSKSNGLDTLVLADDLNTIKFCSENLDLVDGIEIHAACVNDENILKNALSYAKKYDKLFVIGISGFEFQELSAILSYIKSFELENVLLMYGFQNFPTRIDEINLSKIPLIEKAFGYKVGYADHTKYDDENKEKLICAAYAIGANVQEIHYVLNEGVQRTDYISALSGNRLESIKSNLNTIYSALGFVDFRLNDGERKYLNFRKVPVYNKNLLVGTILKEDDISFKRVENPIKQHYFAEIYKYYGKKLTNNVFPEKELEKGDFE